MPDVLKGGRQVLFTSIASNATQVDQGSVQFTIALEGLTWTATTTTAAAAAAAAAASSPAPTSSPAAAPKPTPSVPRVAGGGGGGDGETAGPAGTAVDTLTIPFEGEGVLASDSLWARAYPGMPPVPRSSEGWRHVALVKDVG